MTLPYFTREFPGIGGAIKQRPEDFFVQELPLYEPSGEGEHVYCEIEKNGLTTFDAVDLIANRLNVSQRDIGYAGMKDAVAVSRQIFSIWGTSEEKVAALTIPNITIRWVARHGNKLRLGHLAGNRFAIKIRNVTATDVVKVLPVMKILQTRGLPNFFGEQRFGRRGDNHLLGAALIRGNNEELLMQLLGRPIESDDPQSRAARQAFDRRDNEASMKAWPRRCGMERRILARLMKAKKPNAAVKAIDQRLRRLWVSALQSNVFNDVLAARIDSIDRLLDGDLAYKHDSGGCFAVERAAVEQARCDAFEISPSGPLVGYKISLPTGEPLAIEENAFAAVQLSPKDFQLEGKEKVKGARRSLRIRPVDTELVGGVDEFGGFITVAFTLPPGAYATVVLRELMKAETPTPVEAATEDSADEVES